MNRVFRSWLLKRTIPLLIFEIAAGWIGLSVFAQFVFVEKVVSNALTFSLGNPSRLLGYGFDAFLATSPLIKGIVIIFAALVLLLLRDLNRSIVEYAAVRRAERNASTESPRS
jgi:hypothetical protein